MTWLVLLVGALACWLGYTLCRAWMEIKRGREDPGWDVCLLMGSQPEVAEWFLRSLYRCEGILAGRLTVSVEAERSGDDTAGIVELFSRSAEFPLARPGPLPEPGEEHARRLWVFDVRGMNTIDQLKPPLNVLMAL